MPARENQVVVGAGGRAHEFERHESGRLLDHPARPAKRCSWDGSGTVGHGKDADRDEGQRVPWKVGRRARLGVAIVSSGQPAPVHAAALTWRTWIRCDSRLAAGPARLPCSAGADALAAWASGSGGSPAAGRLCWWIQLQRCATRRR